MGLGVHYFQTHPDDENWIGVIPQGILSSSEIVGFTAINHPQITMFIGDISDMFPNGTVVVQMALSESHVKLCNGLSSG